VLPFVILAVLAPVIAAALFFLRRRDPAPKPVPGGEENAVRRELVLAEAVPAPASISGDAAPPRPRPVVLVPPPQAEAPDLGLAALDALLEELESATVRIDGADALDHGAVAELEALAARLEAAAESLALA
jgi:hypothetical protein